MSAKSRAASAYTRTESCLSTLSKPEQDDNEPKSKYFWRLIRHCVKEAVDLTKIADTKTLIVSHGLHHNRRLNHPKQLRHVVINKATKEYLTLDGEVIRIFHPDGRKKGEVQPEEAFTKLLHAFTVNLYVGWSPGKDDLRLMTSNFELSSTSHAIGPILAAVFNEHIGEVVTVGAGFLTSWVFRYGGRHLLPRKTIQAGLPPEDHFSLLVLEETASRMQKAYSACGMNVAVFNLHEGKLLSYQKSLHVREISALLFFNPLKYLVTGARDGSIKVWDEKWHLQLVFVGHCGPVSSLSVYPHGPLIMSASLDCSIRVWSLETCDQVDSLFVTEPVEYITNLVNYDHFASITNKHVDLWKVQHVHVLHTTIGHKVWKMKGTDHAQYPVRNVLLCRDSSIRIVSPMTGDIITTLLCPNKSKLIDAAYSIAENFLTAVYSNGQILRCDTSTNPCTVLDVWTMDQPEKSCNCLLAYEYVVAAGMRGTSQQSIIKPGSNQSVNRSLLLGGRKDGNICVLNWENGEVEFEIEAHGSKGVLSMIANLRSYQLISSGLDNIIKIWRVYPYSQESLAPLMSFYCAHMPVCMGVMRNILAVGFQEATTATYSIVMYNLKDKDRHDHQPEDDHLDNITGLSSCPRLKLSASSSADGTIRIWNQLNQIVRILKLNAVPNSLCFCSEKGDLLVGIGDHVHKIDYKSYMPKSYRMKMVSMKFPAMEEEKALPFDENLLNMLSREDVKKLKAARSSFKFTHFVDILTEEENKEVTREKKLREKAFSEIEQREQELALIRDGDLKAHHKPKTTPGTKRDAFSKYLKIFYNRPKIEMQNEDDYQPERLIRDLMKTPEERAVTPGYIADRCDTGFFPTPREPTFDTTSEQPRGDGFIPNSVLLRLLLPPESEEKKQSRYVPPALTAEQMDQINAIDKKLNLISCMTRTAGKLLKKKSQKLQWEDALDSTMTADRSRTLFMDYGDDEDEKKSLDDWEKEEEEEMRRQKQREEEEKEAEASNAFMAKVQTMLNKAASPEPEEPSRVSTPASSVAGGQADLRQRPSETFMTETTDNSSMSSKSQRTPRKIQPKRPITKLTPVHTPKPATPTNVGRFSHRHHASPPPTSPDRTPTPPPTPLPEFISQFIGKEWFDKYFPNCNTNTMPKPWTVPAFVSMVTRLLRVAEFNHKIHVAEALRTIHQEHGILNADTVYRTLYSVLNHHTHPPTCLDPTEKAFIMESIQLMKALSVYDVDFYTELIAQFLDGDKEVRNLVMDTLRKCNLKDQHNYLPKELDSWDVWNVDDKDRAGEIRRISRAWLEKWMTSFKLHLEDCIERLRKGQNVSARATPSQLSTGKKASPTNRSILKKPDVGVIDESEEEVSLSDQTADNSKAVTVTFEAPHSMATIENATYIEAINYFCDMQLEKQLDFMRNGGRGADKKSTDVKNTVLVLPKLAVKPTLVRLGETHTSQCRPQRETAFAIGADLTLPPVTTRGKQPPPGTLYGFPSCINLPMKSVHMDPFASLLHEKPVEEVPILLMLRTSQKYFVHSRSVVPTDIF